MIYGLPLIIIIISRQRPNPKTAQVANRTTRICTWMCPRSPVSINALW